MKIFSSIFGSKAPEVDETRRLAATVRDLKAGSSLANSEAEYRFVLSVIAEAGDDADLTPGSRIGGTVFDLVNALYAHEPFALEPNKDATALGLSEGADYRTRLRIAEQMFRNEEETLTTWRDHLAAILGGLFDQFPDQCFVDPDVEGDFAEYSRLSPSAPLYTYVKGLPDLLKRIIGTIFQQHLVDAHLFDDLREQLHINVAKASGIREEDRHTTKKAFVLPDEKTGLDDAGLIRTYLDHTPFLDLFFVPIPLYIPEQIRFEHTHVLAGTGHGKTQTLQFLIAGDLEEAIKEKRSVVVMDSQGDLLKTLLRSEYFNDPLLRERLIYIDPEEVNLPVGLNLFDIDLSKDGIPDAVAREAILNNTIELYDFFFGALLGAELTQKQGLIFRFLAVLMLSIPGANIHTLRELMENGEKFKPYMAKLRGSAKVFFETRFLDRSFSETKKQILNRLWGVLSNQTLDRMMSASKNSVDLFGSLQKGSIVFINTAKDFLGEEGSTVFARMFIALLGQALMRRAAIEKHERTPTYIYIDEAERIVDVTLIRMLAQVRKYKGAITFAHQNLDQLDPTVRAGVIANTSIKLVGGLSAKDARALSEDMRSSPEFLLSMRREKTEAHFACFAKNVTDQAVRLSVPLGYLEGKPTITEASFDALIQSSRSKYGVAFLEPVEEPAPKVESAIDWFGGDDGVEQPEAPTRPAAPAPVPDVVPASPPVAADVPPPVVPIPEPVVQEKLVAIERHAPEIVEKLPPRPPGGGGAKHKYIEQLIKALGEERGFLANLEETVLDGDGRVDVVLRREKLSLAFEISITTTRDHELANVEKCLALPFTHVVVMASHERHLKSLSLHMSRALDDEEKKRVTFLLPDGLPEFLDGLPGREIPARVVKGYTVKSRVAKTDPALALARRKAVAKVVAKSLEAGSKV